MKYFFYSGMDNNYDFKKGKVMKNLRIGNKYMILITEILKSAKIYTESFLNDHIKKKILISNNKLVVDWVIPTKEKYEQYMFDALQEIVKSKESISVLMKPNGSIWLVIDLWEMPINIHFNVSNNIYGNGKLEAEVWINDYVVNRRN